MPPPDSIRGLPHIFARIFNTPLAMPPARLEPLLAGLQAASQRRGSLIAEDLEPARTGVYGALPAGIDWDRGPSANGYVVSREGVAWLPIRGVMAKREGEVAADSTEIESYARIGGTLRASLADPRVRAVMLDVDSPGGEVGGLFDLAADVRAASMIKPIWAIANDDALSAGYALASAADQIWLSSVGGVGSIGVVAMHTDQSRFDAAMGIAYTFIHAGARKVDGHSHAPLNAEARASIQAEVDRLYGMFVDMVADYRGIDAEAVRATEAAVFYGPDAKTAGLADHLGTVSQAIAALGAELTGSTRAMNATITNTGEAGAAAAAQWQSVSAEEIAEAVARAEQSAQVIRLDAVRHATDNQLAEHQDIVASCNLAGFPALATEYMGKRTPLHAVRADLQRRRAEADEARQVQTVDTTPKPSGGAAPDEFSKVLAARWASQMGRKT